MHKSFQVSIEKLTFGTIIGILPFERETPQKVEIDISFKYKFDTKTDSFIDYAEVSNLVKTIMIEKKFKLIEDAIIFIEELLHNRYPLEDLKINIAKPDILKECKVSVGTT